MIGTTKATYYGYPLGLTKWDVLNESTDDPSVMYKLYQSELDAIMPEQVN